MNSASVLGCTLSILARQSSGAPLFDIVVVDEAAKASLPECMIAALSAKRLVLVGDHNQLLPFVDERVLEASGPTRKDRQDVEALWTNSLFKRLWVRAPDSCKVQLTAQYRSRSGIRDAISKLFYDKKLTPGRTDRSALVPFTHSLVWVDSNGRVHDQVYSEEERSLINRHEIGVVLGELRMLASSLSAPRATSIAIICFYGAQREEMERAVRASAVADAFRSCEVRTVDASQGGQWDIVLLSLTRCSGDSTFVGSANRLNVALSRARELAVVVGALRYALQDRNPESMLGGLARHVQTHAGQHVWLGGPTSRGDRRCR
jgi:superfamily I DNA and/or RNA helicase